MAKSAEAKSIKIQRTVSLSEKAFWTLERVATKNKESFNMAINRCVERYLTFVCPECHSEISPKQCSCKSDF